MFYFSELFFLDSAQESYMQQWIAKIVDNIEINLQNVHFRYEDSLSTPGTVFAVGLTLETFEVSTCDENWHSSSASFGAKRNSRKKTSNVSSGDGSKETIINKIAFMKHLGCYWQVDSPCFGDLNFLDWEKEMQSLIYVKPSSDSVASATPSDELKYLLLPFNNSLYMKLTRSKKSALHEAFDDLEIESTNLQFVFDSEQYVQLFNVIDRAKSIKKNVHSCYFFQPASRPGTSIEMNRKWWKYACKLVLAERRYVALFKASRQASANSSTAKTFSPSDAIALRVIEERFPLEPLKAFRRKAFLEMAEEERDRQAKKSGVSNNYNSSWWSGWGKKETGSATHSEKVLQSVPSADLGSDISIESIITKLNTTVDEEKGMYGEERKQMSLKLTSSSTLILSKGFKPIIKANSALSVLASKTSTGFSFLCELKDVLVVDKYTLTPSTSAILSVQDSSLQQNAATSLFHIEGQKPTLSIGFDSKNGKSKITISALPIELSLNRPCINTLFNAFARPKNIFVTARPDQQSPRRFRTPQSAKQDPGKRPRPTGKLTKRLSVSTIDRIMSQQSDDLEISFEASAPKILIPENSSVDRGHLLLDTGHISISGFIGSTGMSLAVAITDINAGLPLSVHDRSSLGEKSLYLIKA